MNIIIPNKPFYQMDLQELRAYFIKATGMDLQELRAYFIKATGKLERKKKTRRKYRTKRRKTARK